MLLEKEALFQKMKRECSIESREAFIVQHLGTFLRRNVPEMPVVSTAD